MAWHSGKPADGDFLSVSVQHIRENFAELEPLQPHVAEIVDLTALQPHVTELVDLTALQPHVTELVDLTALQPHIAALLDSRVVEMGSNSNGTYVRWENGLQVCWFRRSTTGRSITAPFGALYSDQALQSWTFPAAFVSSPVFVGTSEGGADRHPFVKPVSASATKLDYVCVAAQSGTLNMLENLMAIGWWK